MNTIIAQFKVNPGQEAAAEEAVRKMAAAVEAKEPGAQAYIFHRDRKDPAQITVFEIYADDAASSIHRASGHMAAFGALFGTIFDPASVKISRLERIAGFSR